MQCPMVRRSNLTPLFICGDSLILSETEISFGFGRKIPTMWVTSSMWIVRDAFPHEELQLGVSKKEALQCCWVSMKWSVSFPGGTSTRDEEVRLEASKKATWDSIEIHWSTLIPRPSHCTCWAPSHHSGRHVNHCDGNADGTKRRTQRSHRGESKKKKKTTFRLCSPH